MFLLLIILFFVLAFVLHKQIRKYFILLTIVMTIISGLTYFTSFTLLEPVFSGFIATALFINVMFASAFPKHSKASVALFQVRKEYSIFAFILISPHAIYYLLLTLSGDLNIELTGIIEYLIMVPLFIMSFHVVRNKMTYPRWKFYQRFAYLSYALLYAHLVILGTGENTVIYTLVFSVYSVMKIFNYFLSHKGVFTRFATSFVFVGATITFAVNLGANTTQVEAEVINLEDISLVDGVYEGTAYGYEDHIVLLYVTIENGEISSIHIEENGSSEPRKVDYGAAALWAAQEIINQQSTSIDSYAGATHTVHGIIEAVNQALNEAMVQSTVNND